MPELHVRGELYLTLDLVAACYSVEIRWLEQVTELGLLSTAERVEGALAIAARELDRVARIVRWHFHQGIDLGVVAVLLEEDRLE